MDLSVCGPVCLWTCLSVLSQVASVRVDKVEDFAYGSEIIVNRTDKVGYTYTHTSNIYLQTHTFKLTMCVCVYVCVCVCMCVCVYVCVCVCVCVAG